MLFRAIPLQKTRNLALPWLENLYSVVSTACFSFYDPKTEMWKFCQSATVSRFKITGFLSQGRAMLRVFGEAIARKSTQLSPSLTRKLRARISTALIPSCLLAMAATTLNIDTTMERKAIWKGGHCGTDLKEFNQGTSIYDVFTRRTCNCNKTWRTIGHSAL